MHRIRRYTVQTGLIEGNEEFSCIYAKFSKDGILCSHILKVIIEKEISTILEKYIKDRWRKKSTRVHVRREQEETLATSALLRFNVLSKKSAILNSKGLKTEKSMEYLLSKFSKLDVKLDVLFGTQQTIDGNNQQQGHEEGLSRQQEQVMEDGYSMADPEESDESETDIQDPERIKTKGRPEIPKRFRTRIEYFERKRLEQEKKKAAEEKKKAAEERKKATEERKNVTTERKMAAA